MSRWILALLVASVALLHAQDQQGQLKKEPVASCHIRQAEGPAGRRYVAGVKEYSFIPFRRE